MRYLSSVLIALIFFIQNPLQGQDARRFNSDPVIFITELKEKYSNLKDKKSLDALRHFITTGLTENTIQSNSAI